MGDAGYERRAHDHLGRRDREAGRLIAKSPEIAIIDAAAPGEKAHHPDPLPERGRDAARDAGRPADVGARASTSSRSLVIDDGSRDGTADVARAHGVHHVVRLTRNKGLAAAFMAGIDASLKQGADFIVNTDADNQYAGSEIAEAAGAAAARRGRHRHRRPQHRRAAAHVVAQAAAAARSAAGSCARSRTPRVPDTTSGFRAYTREAALRMTIVSEFSYTLESIIQAGKKRMAIAHVPVATNPRTRESRLFDSIFGYIKRSAATIVRIYAMYEPLKVFTLHRPDALRRRAACWRCGSSTPTSPTSTFGGAHRAVADLLGGPHDRRLPGRC